MSTKIAKYFSSCYCRKVRFEVSADPVSSKFCHCKVCQRLHGAPFQWAVIFHKKDVTFLDNSDETEGFQYNSDAMCESHTLPYKLSCKHCKSPIADVGRNMFLAFGPNFEFGIPPVIPESFKPTCHIFYSTHVVEVNDKLPKYLGHKDQSELWTGEKTPIALLGDPILRTVCSPVEFPLTPEFLEEKKLLSEKLLEFRAKNGFGRAISAPQIGIPKRFICLKLDKEEPKTLINPTISELSIDTFTMWDDCMSFPSLLVKVKRHHSVDITYQNEQGEIVDWSVTDRATSELLQHELDHLDGILAVDLAIDKNSIISRQLFEERKSFFQSQVDYIIS